MFKPSLDRVLVKRLDAAEKTKSGLYIAPSAQEKPQEAVVVAVGPGMRYVVDGEIVTVPVEYKEGDKVLISKYGSQELKIEGEEYDLLKESEILGKF